LKRSPHCRNHTIRNIRKALKLLSEEVLDGSLNTKDGLRETLFHLLPSFWARLELKSDKEMISDLGFIVCARLNLIALKTKYRHYGALYITYKDVLRKRKYEVSKTLISLILSGHLTDF